MLKPIFTALRIYDTLTSQHHRKHYCGDRYFNHIAPLDRLLPFQYIRDTAAIFTQVIDICSLDDVSVRTILAAEISADLNVLGRSDGTDVIIYTGETGIAPLNAGTYYLKIQDGAGNTFYSEVFKAMDLQEDECHLKLTASNSCDIGKIYHREDVFEEKLFLTLDLGKPVYKYQEETEEAFDKSLNKTLQRAEKFYTIEFMAPEYICDFFSLLKLYDTIKVVTKDDGEMLIEEINVNIESSDVSDCFSRLTVEFTINKVVKVGCCANIDSYDCMNTTKEDVIAIIDIGDTVYTTPSMVVIPLVDGDRVLYDDGTGMRVGIYNGITMLPVPDVSSNIAGAIVKDLNTGLFFYYETAVTTYSTVNRFNRLPSIHVSTNLVDIFVEGHAMTGFNVQLQKNCDGGGWINVLGPLSAEDFNSFGITAPMPAGDCLYRLTMTNVYCSLLSNTTFADF